MVFEQILDYEYLPFRCHRCHEYGHLAKDCPLGRRRRRFQKASAQWENVYSPIQHFQGQNLPSDLNNADKETVAQNLPSDLNAADMETEIQMEVQPSEHVHQENQVTSTDKESNLEKVSAKEHLPERTSQPSEGVMGMCSDSSIPPVHIVESMDVCMEHSLSNNFVSSLKKNSILNHEEINVRPVIEDISAALPSLDLNSEGVSNDPGPSALLPSCPYNLRSLDQNAITHVSVGGIGPLPSQSQSRKKRGRKSNFSMAQIKAKFDVADGKQQSIPGALRAAHPLEEVIK